MVGGWPGPEWVNQVCRTPKPRSPGDKPPGPAIIGEEERGSGVVRFPPGHRVHTTISTPPSQIRSCSIIHRGERGLFNGIILIIGVPISDLVQGPPSLLPWMVLSSFLPPRLVSLGAGGMLGCPGW